MAHVIETLLHMDCQVSEYREIGLLPLILRSNYRIESVAMAGIYFLCVYPKETVNLALIRKHRQKIVQLTGLECVFMLDDLSSYAKEKMIEENLPFILNKKEIYMPFVGIIIQQAKEKKKTVVGKLSYLTQRFLLIALLQDLGKSTMAEVAVLLGVSKMSVSRCFDEIEAMGLALISNHGTAGRYYMGCEDRSKLWEQIHPLLRNPVQKQYYLDCTIPDHAAKSGMSAVSYYSMLSDNHYPTYAILKEEVADYNLENLPQVPLDETPTAVVQVMAYHYFLEQQDDLVIDPLTAILTLTNKEKNDPRVEAAVEQILEEYIYHERN